MALVSLVSCKREQQQPGEAQPTEADVGSRPEALGGGPVDLRHAIHWIAETRCEREAACGRVGNDQRWATHRACLDELTREYSEDLTAQECPAGVDSKVLTECVKASRVADCARPGAVTACFKPNLCRVTRTEH